MAWAIRRSSQACLAALAATAFSVVAGEEVPIYCRLLRTGLEAAEFEPILGGRNLSQAADVTALGLVNVSVSKIEIGALRLANCGASVDSAGRFTVSIPELDMDLHQVAWQFAQQRFPHMADQGVATAKTSLSFSVAVDMAKEVQEATNFEITSICLELGAQHHSWLAAALDKLASAMRPLLNTAVEHAVQKAMDKGLGAIREQGSCAFVQDMLAKAKDLPKLHLTSHEPVPADVPLLGKVNISMNSTYIKLPDSMQCQQVGFSGSVLTTHVEDLHFSAGFQWAYQNLKHQRWHNQGDGTVKVLAGTLLHIDLLAPSKTSMEVQLPKLELKLQADSKSWKYSALTKIMVPIARRNLQRWGGKLFAHAMSKCLADPSCPRVRSKRPLAHDLASSSQMVFV